jgi:hypothetical protein
LAHTHIITDVTDLRAELDGLILSKANTAHTHVIDDVTGLQGVLDSKALDGHTHPGIPTVDQGEAINYASPLPTASNPFVTVDYLEQNGAAPTVNFNTGGYSNGGFDTTHYPYEIRITIAGTIYAMPARIV